MDSQAGNSFRDDEHEVMASRREFIVGATAMGLAPANPFDKNGEKFTPEMFGAKGDGRTNDTQAFAAMSAKINALGGGVIVLRPTTYIVGQQRPFLGGSNPSFKASDIIRLSRCHLPIIIKGNGAVMRCAAGLRYGRFDRASGKPLPDPPHYEASNQAVPYVAMIHIELCSGPISIRDVELDGNLTQLWVGGKYGDGGYEAGGTGIRLDVNSGSEEILRVHCHHHPQDGMLLTSPLARTAATFVSDVRCDLNARQGCSVTGGRNYSFQNCRFTRTGRAGFHNNPTAGLDIEAELPTIRNVAFSDCEFSDNHGFGLVAGSGDSADIRFDRCKFVGTTNWSVWPDRPAMRFRKCTFVGSLNHCHGDAEPARAAQFVDCIFTDDPRLSPTGKVFLPNDGWIAIVLDSPNVKFSRCKFRLVADGVLPLSSNVTIYADCVMSQRSRRSSAPRGTYIGMTSIRGNALLEDSVIRGTVILNGRKLPVTRRPRSS